MRTAKKSIDLKAIKLVLIGALIASLLPLPYGYYSLLRVFTCLVFILCIFELPKKKRNFNNKQFILYCVIVVLFQPLLKIPLGRSIWNILDILLALWLFISIYTKKKR